jgi:diaminopimelate epimerase
MHFSKMVATGNDFIVMDNRHSGIGRLSDMARRLCDRRFGIGADGLLFLEKSKRADFKMRIFNPDGTEPDMCGNGLRCISLYAKTKSIASSKMAIETRAGLLSASVKDKLVKIMMTDPSDIRLGIDLEIEKKSYTVHHINTGVPHAVTFIDDMDGIDVFRIGRLIRYHKAFKMQGANVNFVLCKGRNNIQMRTYERGVEAETLACGTGAVASAIISSIIKGLKPPIDVKTRGGGLRVYFKKKSDTFSEVFLEGEAKEVFTGTVK